MRQIRSFFQNLTLYQQFMLAGLLILLLGMLGIGAWVEQQVARGVVHRTGATTALFVDSFVSPLVQELGAASQLSPENAAALGRLLHDTPIGQQIVVLKVWDTRGRVVYSSDPALVGQVYPMTEGQLRARLGEVVTEISRLDDVENRALGVNFDRLLETYSPVWLSGTEQVIGVAEFYQTTGPLDAEIAVLQRQSWLVVGGSIALIYLLLAGFVRQASATIQRQQGELRGELLRNEELTGRVRRAARSVALLNEGYLRRTGAELHDGPAQDLGLALLKLDALSARLEQQPAPERAAVTAELAEIEAPVRNAMNEMRGIAAGLSLPQLAGLEMAEMAARVVRAHERRSGTRVALETGTLPGGLPDALKITVYRLIQEALNNAARHAGGQGQRVWLGMQGGALLVEVRDSGPGFVPAPAGESGERLGLAGMRERVESLGGIFALASSPGQGTTIRARLPVQEGESV